MPETSELIAQYMLGQMTTPEGQAQVGSVFDGLLNTPEITALLRAITETRAYVGSIEQSLARIETTVNELMMQVATLASTVGRINRLPTAAVAQGDHGGVSGKF